MTEMPTLRWMYPGVRSVVHAIHFKLTTLLFPILLRGDAARGAAPRAARPGTNGSTCNKLFDTFHMTTTPSRALVIDLQRQIGEIRPLCFQLVSMVLRSMALLLYAASASAGAPSTPAIARGTPRLTNLLCRASSLAPAVALEPVCAWWWPPIPRLTTRRPGGVGREGPGGAANFPHDLRGPFPRLLPPRRLHPAPFAS